MNRQTYKTDLTDDQWTILEPLCLTDWCADVRANTRCEKS